MSERAPYPRLWLRQHDHFVAPGLRLAPRDDTRTVDPIRVAGIPPRWAARINRRLAELFDALPVNASGVHRVDDTADAWRDVESLAASMQGAALPIDASDADVLAFAHRCAERCATEWFRRGRATDAIRSACERIVSKAGLIALGAEVDDGPAIARYLDRKWWSRRVRAAHGLVIEHGAIRLGLVHKRADLYVSEDNLRRRQQQNRRNARILEATKATNEDGEVFTLAELASKSVSNKAIRRGELMLRIRGMEDVAKEAGRVALFAVLTCPSRMHAHVESGQPNPKHDGTMPREAQAWHASNWKKATAALHREGVPFYGARTVEPHHDGTPHWNVLLFLPADRIERVEAIMRRYWLDNESPDEAGAQRHRVRFERIDPAKGSATAYIAKYIAKGIDGAGMDRDLFGNPIAETTTRIEAWAALHRIRQFQTMCSAPVSVWRELRRVKRETIIEHQSHEQLVLAWNAAQRFDTTPADAADELPAGSRADFAAFIRACGGPRTKRLDTLLSLDMKPGHGLTRYGEDAPPKPGGVWAVGRSHRFKAFDGIAALGTLAGHSWTEVRHVVVASVRRVWTIAKGGAAVSFEGFGVPRTRVNNYTEPDLGQEGACLSETDTDGHAIGAFDVDWPDP